jgi:hypothetical protein
MSWKPVTGYGVHSCGPTSAALMTEKEKQR